MQWLGCLKESKIVLDAHFQVMESYTKCRETLILVVRSGFVIKYSRRAEVVAPQGSISPKAVLLMYLFTPTCT